MYSVLVISIRGWISLYAGMIGGISQPRSSVCDCESICRSIGFLPV